MASPIKNFFNIFFVQNVFRSRRCRHRCRRRRCRHRCRRCRCCRHLCERLSIIWTLASRGKGELQGGGSQIQSKLFLSLISFSREKSSENSLNQVEANNN